MYVFSKSSSLFIEELRDIGNLAVASNLSFLKLWFFTLDLFPDLILVLWRTNFKSFRFQGNNVCCNIVVILVLIWRQVTEKVVAKTSAELVVVHFVHCPLSTLMKGASDEICFWWPLFLMTCLQELFFRLVSSDALLQTHSSDAFKLQINSFALDLFNQNLYEYIFDHDPVHLNKCLAYPIDNF